MGLASVAEILAVVDAQIPDNYWRWFGEIAAPVVVGGEVAAAIGAVTLIAAYVWRQTGRSAMTLGQTGAAFGALAKSRAA